MDVLLRRICAASAVVLLSASTLGAQTTGAQSSTQPPPTPPAEETRPATNTFFGDTGLWFVPTGEVLPHGKWSVSGYRRGTNWIQGYTNVADFAGTFAVGIRNRAEIFGSFLVDTRIDRDVRPVFVNDPNFGGVVERDPRVNRYWTGDSVGDFYVGGKFNLLSEAENDPAAFALRAMFKLPTGDSDKGVSTGKADFSIDAILSKEAAKRTEVSGYVGWEFRGQPDGFDASGGAFRWGAGVGYPSRRPLRLTGELNGVIQTSGSTTITGSPLVGVDGSVSPLVSNNEKLTRATLGLTYQSRNGFFAGAGVSWTVPTRSRNTALSENGDDVTGDYFDWQFRIGWHPGVRAYVPPPPRREPAPQPSQNRPPTVRAQCDPCTVEVGRSSTLTANAQDPDGDALMYRWTTTCGTLANPTERTTTWTAPNQEGPCQVTVTVSDGKGGTASDTVTINVTRPPSPAQPERRTYTFEDVYFDFDRYSLRPEATRILDQATTAMREDATLRLTIEGHTCNIGTAEYNLALANRRATAVRDYLVSRGVSADRLNIVSYGEERPKFDNSREETRRLNRRAALVVRLQ